MKLENTDDTHVVMIGAGIMSATLAVMLNKMNPQIKITIFEKLDAISAESSDPLNNAGTGHSGFCELNYTPEDENGNIDITKAVDTALAFEKSKEFWSFLIELGFFNSPEKFIRSVPHMSIVWGEDDVRFLKKRWNEMKQHPLFSSMEFSDDHEKLREWIPLIMKDRKEDEVMACTHMALGTDVNYGALSHMLILNLVMEESVDLQIAHKVKDIKKLQNGKWSIKVKNLTTDKSRTVQADFVFIGAGGGALRLLDKSGIEESKGFGGFPVSGQWLICDKPEIVKQHHAKVYGKAKIGAPPMSVPHMDSRFIDGQEKLLFGPYAGFSTKFLKHGSRLDFAKSLEFDNIMPILSAGIHNISLTKYLIGEVVKNKEDKMKTLREFFPNAKDENWKEEVAGQRVQIIKKDENGKGILQFGTEVVSSKDGTISALLGASPGASTAVKIMLDLIEKCFSENMPEWEIKLREMIPSYKNNNIDADYIRHSRIRTSAVLKLNVSE
ncbi:MAG: malate dehydrogenase (quinone) [Chitinophagales bacterium]|nr:malate dehydrogenase (quinone) [Chitinophagales bacterium]